MGLFGPKPIPATSYGYAPPSGATAHGWTCTGEDCGVSEHEPVKRWPKACPRCGSPTDPLFDPPWDHDAEGVELQWVMRNQPEKGGGFYQDNWEIWQFKDAILRGDRAAVAQARTRARAYAQNKIATQDWWRAGSVYFQFVWYGLEAGDLDGAADDLVYWLSVSPTDDVESNNSNRTNARQVIDRTAAFFQARGGATHPRAPEIKQSVLNVAQGAYPVLNRDLQDAVARIARS